MDPQTIRDLVDKLSKKRVAKSTLNQIRLILPSLLQDYEISQKEITELKAKLTTDALTKLLNKSTLMLHLGAFLGTASEHDQNVSVIMSDIDYFHNYNGSYGHIQGDRALESLAHTLQSSVRPSDVVGRVGGEEFALVLPQTDSEQALALAEKVRSRVESMTIPSAGTKLKDDKYQHITSSLGVFTYDRGLDDVLKQEYSGDGEFNLNKAVLNAADIALFNAKIDRNKVVAYKPGMKMPERRKESRK